MAIKSQVKEGEYIITTYDSGHVIKEIDQAGKVTPPSEISVNPMDALMDKIDKLVLDMETIKKDVAEIKSKT
jgi:hypothetical protein